MRKNRYPLITVYVKDGGRYWRAYLTRLEAVGWDNGALFSCGLTADKDISRVDMDRLLADGRLEEIGRDDWNHSGCQSRCVLRGDDLCQW